MVIKELEARVVSFETSEAKLVGTIGARDAMIQELEKQVSTMQVDSLVSSILSSYNRVSHLFSPIITTLSLSLSYPIQSLILPSPLFHIAFDANLKHVASYTGWAVPVSFLFHVAFDANSKGVASCTGWAVPVSFLLICFPNFTNCYSFLLTD